MKSKPVQIAIIVIGLLVGVIGIFLAMKNNAGADLANSVVLVDVRTGDLFKVSTKNKTILMPAKNPESGERTLVRVATQEDSDGFYMDQRYFSLLESIGGDLINIDRNSGKVDINAEQEPKALN